MVTAIRAVIRADDPSDCAKHATISFLEQTGNADDAEEALKICEENAEEGAEHIDSVEVTDVVAEDESATAQFTSIGGWYNGQTIAVTLVKEDGEWKLDELREIVNFDKAALLAGHREILEATEGLSSEFINCFIRGIGFETNEEIEGILLDPDSEVLGFSAQVCEELAE